MSAMAIRSFEPQASRPVAQWRGRSGRVHALTPLVLADFSLEAGRIYVLAASGTVCWVGEIGDLVADAANRTAFRNALASADAAFAIAAPEDEIARMTLAWDLEAATLVDALKLV